MLNSEVSYVWYWIGWIAKTFDYINRVNLMLPLSVYEGKRKRYDNAVDVVVRLLDPTDPSTERTAPPSSAHFQLDDDPRAPIQQSFGDEFRQHDSVVTMMMFYRRRASPKLRDDMTEVEYGGRGHRTRLRNDP